jgi:hypothetical protein
MYKFVLAIVVALLCLVASSSAQNTDANEFYNEELKWTLPIPDSFVGANPEKWQAVQATGKKGMEDTYNTKLNNKVATLIILKCGNDNFFEATSEYYDEARKGDYILFCRHMNEVIYTTFTTQRNDVKIDTSTTVDIINGLPFQTINIKCIYPGGTIKYVKIARRLFANHELTVSMMYGNGAAGQRMMAAFSKSKFGVRE